MSDKTESAPIVEEAQAGKPLPSGQEGGQPFLSQEALEEAISKAVHLGIKPIKKQVEGLQGVGDKAWDEIGRIKELFGKEGATPEKVFSQIDREKAEVQDSDRFAALEQEIANLKGQSVTDDTAKMFEQAGIDPSTKEATEIALKYKDDREGLLMHLLSQKNEQRQSSEANITQGNASKPATTEISEADYQKGLKARQGNVREITKWQQEHGKF